MITVNELNNCAFKDSDLPLVVVVAATRWNEPPRMRHHITQQLIRWFNVLFVEFFPTEEVGTSRWVQAGDRLLIYRPVISPLPPTRLYVNDPITHAIVNRRYVKNILKAIESLSANQVLLFNFVYHFPQIMMPAVFCYKAYVCFDEFPKMRRRLTKRFLLKAKYQDILFQYYENQVAKGADHCYTPHYPLRDKLSRVNRDVEMLFHAHNPSLVHDIPKRNETGRIRVAFAGYIHYRLIDSWLTGILDETDIDLYLIGPLNPMYDIEQFSGYPNFHLLPVLEENALGTKLAEMDVLIMPYHPHLPEVEVLTTASKLYQYIASERPIVTSDLPNLIEMPTGVVYKATTQEDFVTKVRRAHAEDSDEFRKLRATIAAENTWDRRGEQLHGILKESLGNMIPDLNHREAAQA